MKTFPSYAKDVVAILAIHENAQRTGPNTDVARQNREAAKSTADDLPDLHEEYRRFCEEVKRDLDPIEAEYGGVPTFREWLAEYRREDSQPKEAAHA